MQNAREGRVKSKREKAESRSELWSPTIAYMYVSIPALIRVVHTLTYREREPAQYGSAGTAIFEDSLLWKIVPPELQVFPRSSANGALFVAFAKGDTGIFLV